MLRQDPRCQALLRAKVRIGIRMAPICTRNPLLIRSDVFYGKVE
jgi:hypothetical protein